MTKNLKEVSIKVEHQGSTVLCHRGNEHGYMVRGNMHGGAVAFYFDTDERAYPSMSSQIDGCPALWLESSDYDEDMTSIVFPEFPGWSVHSCYGGRVVSVCLTRVWETSEIKGLLNGRY